MAEARRRFQIFPCKASLLLFFFFFFFFFPLCCSAAQPQSPDPRAIAGCLMEPTTTTPPAAGPSKRRRRALGDLTNLLLLPSTPSPTNPSARRPLPPPPSDASACSSATPVSKPSSAATTPVEEPSWVKSPISAVYTSRKTQRRRRNPAGAKAPFLAGTAASCPPLGRAARASSSHSSKETSVAQDTRPISSSAPCHQAKKKWRTRLENLPSVKPKLPEDFVEKQRAYFQEIDAFELPEEEASEIDLE